MSGILDKDICNKACAKVKTQILQWQDEIRDLYFPLKSAKFTDDERRPHLTAALKKLRKSVKFSGYATCPDVAEDYCEVIKNNSYDVHPIVQEVMDSFSCCKEFANKLCQSAFCAEKLHEFTDTYKVPQEFEEKASSSNEFSNHGSSNNTEINEQLLLKTEKSISEECKVPDQKAEPHLNKKISAPTNEFEKQSSSIDKLSKSVPLVNTESNNKKLRIDTTIYPELLNEKKKALDAKLAELEEERSLNTYIKDCLKVESTARTKVKTEILTDSRVSSNRDINESLEKDDKKLKKESNTELDMDRVVEILLYCIFD